MSVQNSQYICYLLAQDGNYYPFALTPIYYENPQISYASNETLPTDLENNPSITIQVHISENPQVSIDARLESSCKICGTSSAELIQKVYDVAASIFNFYQSQFGFALDNSNLSPPLEITWDISKSAWIGRNIIGEKEECFFPSTDILDSLPEIIAHESMHRIMELLYPISHEGQAGALYIHFADVMTLFYKYLYHKNTNFEWKVANRDFTQYVHMKSYKPDLQNTIVSNNSRIPNHVFYLLVMKFNDMNEIIKIWLIALNNLKSSNPTFANFAKNTIIAVSKPYGFQKTIYNNWKKVGIGPKIPGYYYNTPQTNKSLKKVPQQNSNP